MATSLITQPAKSLSLKWQEEEISLKDTFFSALASCKGDIFQEVLVWSHWNLFLGVSLVLQELCPGQGCIRHKVKKERKKRERKSRAAASGWLSYTDVLFPRALVTDRTGLVRGPDGTVPGPDTILHSERQCCQVGRNHILPRPKSSS